MEELKKLADERQNDFINRIFDDISHLQEKSFKSEYKPTDYERQQFAEIYKIIVGMNKWF